MEGASVRGGGKKYPGNATITVSVTTENNYSVCEYETSFTLVTPSIGRRSLRHNNEDDTDVDTEDDDFLEYSEVTFDGKQNNNAGTDRAAGRDKNKIDSDRDAPLKSSKCRSLCALTYNSQRERKKTVIAHNFDSRSLDDHSDQGSSVATPSKQRKISKYGAEAQVSLKPIEGSWVLVGSDNYRAYLRAIGAGRYSVDLAMRAATIIRIHQEPDKQWRISTESLIRAKSVRGYRSSNRKWTENKFKADEAKPEVLEDWDPRFVVTTLSCSQEGDVVILSQVAEKDMFAKQDSVVTLEVEEADPDTMIMTASAGDVTGWRKFERQSSNTRGPTDRIEGGTRTVK